MIAKIIQKEKPLKKISRRKKAVVKLSTSNWKRGKSEMTQNLDKF